MAVKQLSDGGPQGTALGQSATDKIGFYGKTPVTQAAVIAALTTTPTTAEFVTFGNSVRTALINLGLIASA